jgi:hypothetical protein
MPMIAGRTPSTDQTFLLLFFFLAMARRRNSSAPIILTHRRFPSFA